MLCKTKKICAQKQIEWLEEHAKEGCNKCGVITDTKVDTVNRLTFDHLIPRMILDMLGIESAKWFDEENNQVLCYRCNQYKNCQLDFTNPKTKQLLIKYLTIIENENYTRNIKE